tara:strand:+ start:584 stop:886 length:303 start_codon:yes stop_codon:yes gene_type:complete
MRTASPSALLLRPRDERSPLNIGHDPHDDKFLSKVSSLVSVFLMISARWVVDILPRQNQVEDLAGNQPIVFPGPSPAVEKPILYTPLIHDAESQEQFYTI